jgi:GntR family transcriptional regulator / MocR family aminotransferase
VRKGRARIIKLPTIDPHKPVQSQLLAHLRQLILTGAIAEGARMPAQRVLSRELKVSRNTVIHAYEALAAEGLVEGRPGAGTYVSARPGLKRSPNRGGSIGDIAVPLPLQPGAIDLSLFPIDEWRRVDSARWRSLKPASLGAGDAAGWSGLRFILAQRIAAIRGVSCTADQVHVVPSTVAGIRLICAALGLRGGRALVETPGYPDAHAALTAEGVDTVAMNIDDEGAGIDAALAAAPDAKLIHLTPSSQFPTGAPLSRRRRKAALRWASERDGWIIEDDYESDFVFEGAAPHPLAAESGATRVIYINSLNNVLAPTMRLAFIVVPEALIDRFRAAHRLLDPGSDIARHMAVHDFMEAGYLAAHLRRCRELYGERRHTLRLLLQTHCADELILAQQPIGLHVTAWLAHKWDDRRLSAKAAEQNLTLQSISDCHDVRAPAAARPGLVLGFAGFDPPKLERAVVKLASLMKALRR